MGRTFTILTVWAIIMEDAKMKTVLILPGFAISNILYSNGSHITNIDPFLVYANHGPYIVRFALACSLIALFLSSRCCVRAGLGNCLAYASKLNYNILKLPPYKTQDSAYYMVGSCHYLRLGTSLHRYVCPYGIRFCFCYFRVSQSRLYPDPTI